MLSGAQPNWWPVVFPSTGSSVNLFIRDLGDGTEGTLSKFFDDINWEEWLIPLPLERNNPKHQYRPLKLV